MDADPGLPRARLPLARARRDRTAPRAAHPTQRATRPITPRRLTPEAPIVLALLRAAIAIVVLVSPEPDLARLVVARGSALWIHPAGLGWLGTTVPLTPKAIAIATHLLTASAALVLAGIWTRAALVALGACLLYVFGAAQLSGTVTHDMHLFWLTVLLAALPRAAGAGRALSLDAWASGSFAGPPATPESSLGVLTARVWLGFVYFFPGVQKLVHGGAAWTSGEILRGQLYFKWYESGGVVPWPRIDRVPWLLGAAAVGVLAFELAMPALVVFRRTRPAALVLGLAFHLGAGHFLDVLFPSLMACYVVLLPGERLLRFFDRGAPESPSPSGRSPHALAIVALGFTAAIVVTGARGLTQAYPFACYPTFADRAPPEIVDLVVEDPANAETFRLALRRSPNEWGMVWRLAGLYGDPASAAQLEAFARVLVPPSRIGGHLRWIIERYDVRPESYGEPPRHRQQLYER